MQAVQQAENYEIIRNDEITQDHSSSVLRMNWIYEHYSYFIIFSFIGWIWETVITSIDEGSLQKRGFLDLPLLPIYGFAITMIVLLFYKKGYSVVKIFIGSALVTSICEFITSWTMEQMFHRVWWDYSQMRFQIQGRICLIGALIFGLASVLIVCLIQPKVHQAVNRFLAWEKSRSILNISAFVMIGDTMIQTYRLLH